VIAQETERLSRLTQRILDFSRMEAGRKAYALREESVPEVVQQALDACKPLIEQGGFTVEKDLAAEAQTAVIDRDAIVEVLINLVTNAIKYSPEQKWLKVAARVNDGFVELSVADHGIGIARADQGRVFEKFYRVDCRRTTEVGGCGIGLSLVQHIVKAHRGEVRLVSEPGKGSTFTVRLPRTAEGETDGEHPGGRG
jgi:signal transduction histidine kinase